MGSYRIRGKLLCKRFGYRDLAGGNSLDQFSTCIIIKALPNEIPKAYRYLIDPLDVFIGYRREPVNFWISHIRHIEYKLGPGVEWVATSESVAQSMRVATRRPIHIIPHWPDPNVNAVEFNPHGPLYYHGQRTFLPEGCMLWNAIQDATGCQIEAAPFQNWKPCTGVLSIRHPYRRINSECKPQIKLANALAAGLPCLCSDLPAVRSLLLQYPFMEAVEVSRGLKSVADAAGLDGLLWILPTERTYELPSHLCRMRCFAKPGRQCR